MDSRSHVEKWLAFYVGFLVTGLFGAVLVTATHHRQTAHLIPSVEYVATTTTEPPTTTTEAPTTTTIAERTTTTRRANRGAVRTAPPVVAGHDFWWRLGNCESENGRTSANIFQLVGHGYQPGQSYQQQLQEAQAWAAKIHPKEGTTLGWPNCWWVALRG